jgi:hypothetical protein
MEYAETIDAEALKRYSMDLLEAMQEMHDAQRAKLIYARMWDEYFAVGMSTGQFAGKNEATRLGEAISANLDLWTKLSAATDEALKREHRFKEIMVVDKWVGRTVKLMEMTLGKPIVIDDPIIAPLNDEEYKAELEKLMARRLAKATD